jgi:hypothetical protein
MEKFKTYIKENTEPDDEYIYEEWDMDTLSVDYVSDPEITYDVEITINDILITGKFYKDTNGNTEFKLSKRGLPKDLIEFIDQNNDDIMDKISDNLR